MKSDQPFPKAFRLLRELRGLSERQVTALARPHGGVENSTMHRVYTGALPAAPHHLKAVAAALQVEPEVFVEYRLWKVIGMFDIVGDAERKVKPIPFDRALRNLTRFEELSESFGD